MISNNKNETSNMSLNNANKGNIKVSIKYNPQVVSLDNE